MDFGLLNPGLGRPQTNIGTGVWKEKKKTFPEVTAGSEGMGTLVKQWIHKAFVREVFSNVSISPWRA